MKKYLIGFVAALLLVCLVAQNGPQAKKPKCVGTTPVSVEEGDRVVVLLAYEDGALEMVAWNTELGKNSSAHSEWIRK